MARSLSTPLCSLLGIDVPVIQAPIGSASTPRLAAAVSGAGGLGHLAATWLSNDELEARIKAVKEATDRPFAVNLVMAFPTEDKIRRAIDLGVTVISTAWGDPTLVRPLLTGDATLHLHVCGSVDEARRAADAGVDVVVAQGWEAGGHVLGMTASLPLIPAVVDAVSPVPVVAAGGIADGRGLAAALALGAQAAWIGTRFLTADEAHTHDVYRRHVIDSSPDSAVYTTAFDGGWPGAPHRALRNQTLTVWEAAGRPLSPDRPGEGDVVAVDAAGEEHQRYEDLMPLPGMTGNLDEMALYAGQSVGLVNDVAPAAEIVRRIVAEATAVLEGLSRG